MQKAKPFSFRRSPFLLCYWKGERLVFENYATGAKASAAPITCEVLNFFSDWRTAESLCAHLDRFSPSSLRQAVAALVRQTFLQRSGRTESPAERKMQSWRHWNPAAGFLHFSTKDLAYESDPSMLRTHLKRLVRAQPRPASVKRYLHAKQISLPQALTHGEFPRVLAQRRTWRRFSPDAISAADLGTLLGLTWGVQEWAQAPEVGRFALKTSPSGGALHPIEAYVLARNVGGISPGLYHYDAERHKLELLRRGLSGKQITGYLAGQDWFAGAAAVVMMTAVFPRTQWKYKFPRAYRVVLAEAGHLCQTFCLVATWLGLAPFCTMALADSRIERDLGIDGVTESVLYAAGVGKRPAGMDWMTASVPESIARKTPRAKGKRKSSRRSR